MYHKALSEGYNSIVRDSDNAWIPLDEQNMDYQDFLRYLEDNDLTMDDVPDYNI